ncbi:hypothetical protein N7540_011123 [Penicillium herquei]|nr:hypothetical protein N7540_011123 [Penicillium herquei]
MRVSATTDPASPGDTRYAQLRLYGKPDCFSQNWGELGVYGNYVNFCNNFGDIEIQSVSFESAINNCTSIPNAKSKRKVQA